MSPILAGLGGISIRGLGHFGPVRDTGAMFPLQVVTIGSAGASSITFSNIPSTYTHLQIRAIVRGTATGTTSVGTLLQFNGSTTGGTYGWHYLEGNGSTVAAGSNVGSGVTSLDICEAPRAGTTASVFAGFVIDILDYANTNKYKTTRSLAGYDTNGGGKVDYFSGLWQSTNAITSIALVCGESNFAQYSQFALYAVKGA